MYVYCVYLWTSEGLSERNRKILQTLEEHTAAHGRPWVAGGDFQIPAEVMKATNIPRKMKGAVLATASPSCTQGKGSVIDYYIVDKRIQGYFNPPSVILSSSFKPHRPVEVCVTTGWQQTTSLYAKSVKKFPEDRVIGPSPPPADWSGVGRRLEALNREGRKEECEEGIQDAWGEWVRVAERELVNHFGLHEEGEKYCGRAEGVRFRTLPVLGWHGTKREGATSAKGAVMRVVANRLGEACKLYWVCRRGQQDGKGEQRRGHLRELCSYTGSYINRAVCNGHLLDG